jgi:hypothetical protein
MSSGRARNNPKLTIENNDLKNSNKSKGKKKECCV